MKIALITLIYQKLTYWHLLGVYVLTMHVLQYLQDNTLPSSIYM